MGGSRSSPPKLTDPSPAARRWQGWGTALKPSVEEWILCRKPLEGTVAANIVKWGVGALNVDGCRIGQPVDSRRSQNSYCHASGEKTGIVTGSVAGRFPSHLCLSPDAAAMLDEQSGERPSGGGSTGGWQKKYVGGGGTARVVTSQKSDSGGASRFFYVAKASRADREEGLEGAIPYGYRENGFSDKLSNTKNPRANHHPTVKPTALMRWLVRLVTPPGGTVLDPFCGSGSTGKACVLEGFNFVGVEREPEYAEIARKRIAAAERQGRLRP